MGNKREKEKSNTAIANNSHRKNKKISKQEQIITERIFMLTMSIRLLEQGRKPFHNEAIKMLHEKIRQLKYDGE